MPKTKLQQLITTPIRISLLLIAIVGVLLTNPAFGQDFGLPDSAYFGEPYFKLDGCTGTLSLTLPVLLWCDRYADQMWYGLRWTGDTECDTVLYFLTGDSDTIYSSVYFNYESNIASGGFLSIEGGICPTIGTEKIMECSFPVEFGDTIHVWFPNEPVHIGSWVHDWLPSIRLLDTAVVVPDTFLLPPGDVDCSLSITISDAVYLIQFIFAGGCAPWSLSAADPNADCSNTISDVVYLINYIFAGGPPPQAGCVGQ